MLKGKPFGGGGALLFELSPKKAVINDLYKDFNIYVIEAKRNINSNVKKRGNVEEVIITNY